MIRPVNLLMTGCAVVLGAYVVSGAMTAAPAFAALAAMCAAAFGNVINDIFDVKSDRVSHPTRPLASGALTVRAAAVFAACLAAASLAFAAAASAFHLAAAAAPVAALAIYSIYFKRTPLAGNLVVAALTAYALLYGALPQSATKILIIPAALAFLLNFSRELVKDVQDAAGDAAAGWRTSASLPAGVIRIILLTSAALYVILVLAPSLVFGHFGIGYTMICLLTVIPVHLYWMMLVIRTSPTDSLPVAKIGKILKWEMLLGMIALVAG